VNIRAEILARRRALDSRTLQQVSEEVIRRFLAGSAIAPEEWQGRCVALYRSLAGELDLRILEKTLLGWGARLCFPRVIDSRAAQMEFAWGAPPQGLHVGEDPSVKWPQGAHGIVEPPSHHAAADPRELDMIFVPGVAFGLQGERIGMGAGYYDRYLPQAPQALRIALAFDFQLLPKIEQKPWDQAVHWIWTEQRDVRLKFP
jgi:5-formyltetrahydrofolate cyclo-ligase